ncbi:MAG: hydrogenase nickel incorporation protein HypB [Thermodesulfovibrionia bacterium]
MCDTCGCNKRIIDINEHILKANEEIAQENRRHLDRTGTFAINLIGSPGSGKTTLLERTIERLNGKVNIGVIEGDIETEIDAERIRRKGVPAIQLTTGGACHLESSLIHKGIHEIEESLNGRCLDILFIENVGNLVCPSFFNLGEHMRVVLVSVTEGSDKPLKYPKAFKTSNLFVITKSDLLPYLDFDIDKAIGSALSINPSLRTIITSSKTGEGIDEWIDALISARG